MPLGMMSLLRKCVMTAFRLATMQAKIILLLPSYMGQRTYIL